VLFHSKKLGWTLGVLDIWDMDFENIRLTRISQLHGFALSAKSTSPSCQVKAAINVRIVRPYLSFRKNGRV
jgi:hypothetical protein